MLTHLNVICIVALITKLYKTLEYIQKFYDNDDGLLRKVFTHFLIGVILLRISVGISTFQGYFRMGNESILQFSAQQFRLNTRLGPLRKTVVEIDLCIYISVQNGRMTPEASDSLI